MLEEGIIKGDCTNGFTERLDVCVRKKGLNGHADTIIWNSMERDLNGAQMSI